MDIQRPDSAALAHLKAELAYLRALLNSHLRRMQRAGLLPPPEAPFPGTSISPKEVEARGKQHETPGQLLDALEDHAQQTLAASDKARAMMARATPDLPLARIKSAFDLSDDEYLVVLLSIAPEFDPGFSRLFAYLQNHFERQYATLALITDCLRPPGESPDLRWILDPEGTLRSNALVQLDQKKQTVPVMHQAILSDPRIVRFVQGFPKLDEKLAALGEITFARDVAGAEPILGRAEEAQWAALMALVEAHKGAPWELPVLVFRGPPGVGKHRWAATAAARMGMNLVRVDLTALVAEYGSLEWGLRVALREARAQQAMLCLDKWGTLVEPRRVAAEDQALDPRDPRKLNDVSRVLMRVMSGYPGTFAVAIEASMVELPRLRRQVKVIDLAMPDQTASIKLWTMLLPRVQRAPGLTSKRLSQAFRLTPGQIIDGVAEARVEAAGEGLTFDGIADAVKNQVRHRLGDNASLVELDYEWSDLIVTEEVSLQLRELIGRYNSRTLVYETWGMGKRFGTGQGLSVLFEGPPGTGKTMAASIVAREMELDVFQIDLSKVVSRYIGETEKNLGKIFDEAERARALLLFDEADSLFAARTQVKSSNDRYANLEVNYLLQRVEHFTGVAILTTNFPTGIDEAFRRRIAMRVSFPKPEEAERARLWDTMLVNKQILAADIDCEDLAYEFELAGGHIKNAVLRAAFIAANRGCLIDQELLRIAARIELKEQGLLVHGSPYEELRDHQPA